MANYAFLDDDNIVTDVIYGIDETELIEELEPEIWYEQFRGQKCRRTSFNGNIRKNFAGIGFKYDPKLDAFIPPTPYKSWVLDESTATWIPPKSYPNDSKEYFWNEKLLNWEEVK